MQKISTVTFLITLALILAGCGTARKIHTGASGINPALAEPASEEAIKKAEALYSDCNEISFNTLSAKIKINYTDANGSQPEVNAFLRVKKDSAIWISVTASFLNIEGMRILITKDSIIMLNRIEKTIESHPVDFVSEWTAIPFTFDELRNIIAGMLIFCNNQIKAVNQAGDFLQVISESPRMVSTSYFKMPEWLLARQNIRIAEPGNELTADLLYEDYEKGSEMRFSTLRSISIPEKEIHITLSFKQLEFNNELSLPFSRPGGYTIK